VQRPSWPFATADYFHTDHLGTTRYMSRDSGNVFEPVAYSAFGEQVSGVDFHFYGYAGAWGYRANYGFPFLHVGARYYDPATGRFLQRDPIGINGGINIYTYVRNAATTVVDPHGLHDGSPAHWSKYKNPPGFPRPKPAIDVAVDTTVQVIDDNFGTRERARRTFTLMSLTCAGGAPWVGAASPYVWTAAAVFAGVAYLL
jgi:RHS repeat-associated protein